MMIIDGLGGGRRCSWARARGTLLCTFLLGGGGRGFSRLACWLLDTLGAHSVASLAAITGSDTRKKGSVLTLLAYRDKRSLGGDYTSGIRVDKKRSGITVDKVGPKALPLTSASIQPSCNMEA